MLYFWSNRQRAAELLRACGPNIIRRHLRRLPLIARIHLRDFPVSANQHRLQRVHNLVLFLVVREPEKIRRFAYFLRRSGNKLPVLKVRVDIPAYRLP